MFFVKLANVLKIERTPSEILVESKASDPGLTEAGVPNLLVNIMFEIMVMNKC